ncbi:MAG TPA: acetyl-CoA carboxylase biotin carboxylase subunit [Alphaproteobacteria bacterium]|nr:acetyl-CoA carboxylase biotin carboxylase subunit [Alphaproteobacteria bacterium]MDP6271390.1 acetyl-CoA carboxylase biotin carboxylase subunit [Alphaproteobacteria bacterium]HJM51360.1 acetyl-CoA carboxylase biotin carboxylase subunit [Alphaproteobacteria bacterium]
MAAGRKKPGLQRILVANRGEIALRIVRACRQANIETVAVHSTADAGSAHVWAADSAVCIGPPPSSESYLNSAALLHVARSRDCDGLHPGYGFLAENAEFASRCADAGLTFIGPSADTIALMGDKVAARQTAERYGLKVPPGSGEAFSDGREAAKAAADIGFPLLLKARSGGGGRGMRIVGESDPFEALFAQASGEAASAFGDGGIYLERYFPTVRHIEVQVFGDSQGNARHLWERDCSLQRRHQKLLEEAPSPVLDEAIRTSMCEAAEALTREIGYVGAGTVEFIYDTDSREFFFIEMNTRIQVEHPVTEMVTGLDLVAEQLRVAGGEALSFAQDRPKIAGHAIEFRLNAEDPANGFMPSLGRLERWRPPAGSGVRLDSHVFEGYSIPPYYDSLLGKLVVHGHDRDDAVARAATALAGFGVDGVHTTIPFHRWILEHPDFLASRIHTTWLDSR